MDTLAVEVRPVSCQYEMYSIQLFRTTQLSHMYFKQKLPESNRFGILSTLLQSGFKGSFT